MIDIDKSCKINLANFYVDSKYTRGMDCPGFLWGDFIFEFCCEFVIDVKTFESKKSSNGVKMNVWKI